MSTTQDGERKANGSHLVPSYPRGTRLFWEELGRGEEEALAYVQTHLLPRLPSMLQRRFGGNRARYETTCLSTFRRLYCHAVQNPPEYDLSPTGLLAYVFQIAARRFMDRIRRRKEKPLSEATLDQVPGRPGDGDPVELAQLNEVLAALDGELLKAGPLGPEVFRLWCYEGCTQRQICERLDKSHPTIKRVQDLITQCVMRLIRGD